ncbi:hypothetical protein H6P81_015535 [Aristolochia fimbriata]|uniref:Uncharacterized protein n=1 Tax=Aristolochia fimbriata TaxID=158543 RepID=A0AAV7E5V1_ARIFI|nr:hypothetical protein H6P81_015535 [Aristolochia fimbriata]
MKNNCLINREDRLRAAAAAGSSLRHNPPKRNFLRQSKHRSDSTGRRPNQPKPTTVQYTPQLQTNTRSRNPTRFLQRHSRRREAIGSFPWQSREDGLSNESPPHDRLGRPHPEYTQRNAFLDVILFYDFIQPRNTPKVIYLH